MSWFNPPKIKNILGINQVRYKNKVFEIYGYYMWKNNQCVSRILSINGAVVKHVLYDLNGKWLSEQSNTLEYLYNNTNRRVKRPKV